MPKQVTLQIDSLKDGLADTIYQGGKNQFAPSSRELDFGRSFGIIQPELALTNDIGDTRTFDVRAVIRASNGTYYWVGKETAGTEDVQMYTGSPGGSTTLTAVGGQGQVFSSFGGPTKLVEFDDDLFFYSGLTNLHKFDIGGSVLSQEANGATLTSNAGRDLLLAKSFLYYCNNNKVGRATNTTTYNDSAITLPTKYRVVSLAEWSNKVIVGTTVQNNADYSKLWIWDGVSTLVDYSVIIPDTGLSAVVNNGGIIYIFCVSNPQGDYPLNVLKIYAWAGGDKVELIKSIDLENTSTNLFTIEPALIDVFKDKTYFALGSGTANVVGRDNGVYSLDRRGALNLEFIDPASADVTQLDMRFLKFLNGELFWFYDDGTTDFKTNISSLTYSSSARLDTIALRFNPRYEARIDEIVFPMVTLPASTSIAVSISTDQASFSAVKTISSGSLATIINQNDFAFQPGHTHQLRFAFTSSGSSRARIILPIYIKASIFDSQQLTS